MSSNVLLWAGLTAWLTAFIGTLAIFVRATDSKGNEEP